MFAQTNYVTVNAPLDSGITFDPIKSPFGNFITTLIRGAQAIYCKQPAIQVNSYVFKKLGVLLFVVCYLQLHHAFLSRIHHAGFILRTCARMCVLREARNEVPSHWSSSMQLRVNVDSSNVLCAN
jgi:hypothetical protein